MGYGGRSLIHEHHTGLLESAVSGTRHVRTPQEVLCLCLKRWEPGLIHSGASMDLTCSSTFHGWSIGLGSGELCGQVDVLSSLSRSLGEFLSRFCSMLGCTVLLRGCAWSSMVFGWVMRVNWHPHEFQCQRFPGRTIHCDETIHVIYFNC